MMGDEKNEFRVVDRRASASTGEKEPTKKSETRSGEGFVMKEAPPAEAAPPSQIDFSTLCLSLATGALIHLGLTPDPMTKQVAKNVELAKQNIDILTLLRDKTKGNLTAEEAKLLDNLLTEVQLRFVEASRH